MPDRIVPNKSHASYYCVTLQVAPVLQQGASSTIAYFGRGLWYNLYDYSIIDATSSGKTQTVNVHSPVT